MFNGKISISRDNHDTIHITITDAFSGTRFLDARMTCEDFGKAVTGLGYMDIDFELRPNHVGKERELKTEIVPLPDKFNMSKKDKQKAVLPFEIDGWKCHHIDDVGNHHRFVKQENGCHFYRVGFIRFNELV